MGQTPIAEAPPTHPELLTGTFITMQQAGGAGSPAPADDGDPDAWLREQLGLPL